MCCENCDKIIEKIYKTSRMVVKQEGKKFVAKKIKKPINS